MDQVDFFLFRVDLSRITLDLCLELLAALLELRPFRPLLACRRKSNSLVSAVIARAASDLLSFVRSSRTFGNEI